MNGEAQVELRAAMRDLDEGTEDIGKIEAGRREDETDRVRLEPDEIRDWFSVLENVTPRSDGYNFSEHDSYVSFPLCMVVCSDHTNCSDH